MAKKPQTPARGKRKRRKRPYKFRADGPGQTRPPRMIETAAGPVELRTYVASLALDGLNVTAIQTAIANRASRQSIREWLSQARRSGVAIPREGGHFVVVNGKRIAKGAYAMQLANIERLRPREIAVRLTALGAPTSQKAVYDIFRKMRQERVPVLLVKGGRA